MSITVKTYSWQEVQEYKEKKYVEFLKYYHDTEFTIAEILKIMGLNNRNSTAVYIRKQLKNDGYNSYKRQAKIKKGVWICKEI